jgi:hypothetical protein
LQFPRDERDDGYHVVTAPVGIEAMSPTPRSSVGPSLISIRTDPTKTTIVSRAWSSSVFGHAPTSEPGFQLRLW